jgi:hypothetical protein
LVLAESARAREAAITRAILADLASEVRPEIPANISPTPTAVTADIMATNIAATAITPGAFARPAMPATMATTLPGHAVLLEGLPDGSGQLETLCAAHHLPLSRIAPGCLCCAGQVIMRVTVNRLLRQRPRHLYIGLATATHQAQLREILQHSPYDGWLTLGDDLV